MTQVGRKFLAGLKQTLFHLKYYVCDFCLILISTTDCFTVNLIQLHLKIPTDFNVQILL